MAANKKPKKKYRPRPVFQDPVAFVIAGNRPAPQESQLKAKISYHMAMTRITRGEGDAQDWTEIANSVNLSLVLAEMGYGVEYVPQLVKAQGAMILLRDRFKGGGRMVCRADEMAALNEALALHDEQLEIAPLRDIERAVRHVEQQFAKGNFVTLERIKDKQTGLTALAS